MSTPILIVHGALGSAATMQPLADALRAAHPHGPVECLELPGHGATAGDDETFTMPAFATRVIEAARRGVPPVVFGYSMGGYAALLAAARAPGSVAGVVTYGTMFDWTPEVAEGAARRLDADVLRAKVPAFAAELETRHAGAGGMAPMLRRTAALLRALGAEPPLTASTLGAVTVPATLLVGERDDTVSFDSTAARAAMLVSGRARRVDGAPHPIERVPLAPLVEAVMELVRATSAVHR